MVWNPKVECQRSKHLSSQTNFWHDDIGAADSEIDAMSRKTTTRKKRSPPNTAAKKARIRADIKADPDARELTAAELARMRPFRESMAERRHSRSRVTRRKIPIVVRLDRHIVKFFRSDDPDWQTRMNAVLAEYVRRHQQSR